MSEIVSNFNYEFCIFCQDTRKVLGHSSLNCPDVICKNCSIKGHNAGNCPKPVLDKHSIKAKPKPSEAEIGLFLSKTFQEVQEKAQVTSSKKSLKKECNLKILKRKQEVEISNEEEFEPTNFKRKKIESSIARTSDLL